jgi:hypothetical protein
MHLLARREGNENQRSRRGTWRERIGRREGKGRCLLESADLKGKLKSFVRVVLRFERITAAA